jgi:ribonuclease III
MTFVDLQNNLNIHFTNIELLKQAFIHRSFLNEDKTTKFSNERLEFLGDSVLSFLTSHFLYTAYPEYPEGILTNIRSSLVKTKTLSQISEMLHLGDLLFLSKGEEESGGRKNQSLLADVFEALLGSIFLDQGIDVAKTFLEKQLFTYAQEMVDKKAYVDYKSHLQEVVQEKTKISPLYRVVKSEGPDHDKTFWIEVISENITLGTGTGKSKQEAEQAAAKDALEKKPSEW